MVKKSKKNTLNKQDLQQWGKNVLIFASPLLVVFLTALQNGVPMREALYVLYGAGINALIDLLRKYRA